MASQGLNFRCAPMIVYNMLCNVESDRRGSVDEPWSFGGFMFQYLGRKCEGVCTIELLLMKYYPNRSSIIETNILVQFYIDIPCIVTLVKCDEDWMAQ